MNYSLTLTVDDSIIVWSHNIFKLNIFQILVVYMSQAALYCMWWLFSLISKIPWYFLVLVAYLIILGAIQADSRESPKTIQVDYTLLGHYLHKWDILIQARSANFLLTFQPFSSLIPGQYPEKETQVSSSNIAKYSQQESNNYISKMAF